MTPHPARTVPAHPWNDPAALAAELDDIDTLTADVFGPDVPLRDRVATLVADWQDYDQLSVALSTTDAMVRAMHARRGLA